MHESNPDCTVLIRRMYAYRDRGHPGESCLNPLPSELRKENIELPDQF